MPSKLVGTVTACEAAHPSTVAVAEGKLSLEGQQVLWTWRRWGVRYWVILDI
jgi:hypothetical protein